MANVSQPAAANAGRQFRLLAALVLCAVPVIKAQGFFALKDVHPGLHGIGRSIFQGNRIEDFQVEILGVIQSSGPKQSIVLARLSGGPLAQTGVIQGMSGSPVYIDGKLLGAVALGFAFSKEPIAGIQPIEQMIADSSFSPAVDTIAGTRMPGTNVELSRGSRLHWPVTLVPALPAVNSFPQNLTQILTPLAITGFTPRTLETFAPEFRRLGFEPQQAVSSGSPSSQTLSGTVAPGSMISVQLVSGDMSVGADGTVTYVDGKRIYAFGHRFLDSGSTEMPFARSEVIAILPTLNTSFKLSTPKEWVGSIVSDRSVSVAGEIGRRARTVPVSITVHSRDTGPHNYLVQVVNDRLMTPFLTQTVLFSAIDATERTLGAGTIRLHTHVNFEGGLPPLDLHDIFVSDSGLAAQVSADAVVTSAFILSSGFDAVRIRDMAFELDPVQSKQQLYILQAWTSAHDVHPGEPVTVTALLGGENGVQVTRKATYRIPIGAPAGLLNFTVSDANTQNFPEFAGMNAASAKTAPDLIRLINHYRGAEAAYVRVWRSQPAFTIAGPLPGGEITDPPPSVMLILADPSESPTSNAAQLAIRGSGIAEIRLPVDGYVVSGAKTVQVEVKE
ncbi:MAG TPA: SpoIVB peptidase S55 domain-containing protein [Bryobacteraceae bacterium]|jgi:hypothetical protein|nr:SpoIVB peptidase S55 domain-containing protein [Bryobacteraceae bacterium]